MMYTSQSDLESKWIKVWIFHNYAQFIDGQSVKMSKVSWGAKFTCAIAGTFYKWLTA